MSKKKSKQAQTDEMFDIDMMFEQGEEQSKIITGQLKDYISNITGGNIQLVIDEDYPFGIDGKETVVYNRTSIIRKNPKLSIAINTANITYKWYKIINKQIETAINEGNEHLDVISLGDFVAKEIIEGVAEGLIEFILYRLVRNKDVVTNDCLKSDTVEKQKFDKLLKNLQSNKGKRELVDEYVGTFFDKERLFTGELNELFIILCSVYFNFNLLEVFGEENQKEKQKKQEQKKPIHIKIDDNNKEVGQLKDIPTMGEC